MTEGGVDPWPPGSPSADRPVVWVNCAMSLDGKIALAGGRRARLSGPADLERVQRIRAHSDAILVGRGTVEKDDPSLRVHWELLGPEGEEIRRSRGAGWAPWRICLDTRGGIPASSRILDGSAPTAIITTRANSRRYPPHVRVASLPGPEVDLPEALRWLRKELGVRRLLVEGGSAVIASVLRSRTCDLFTVFVASRLIGGSRSPSLLAGPDSRTLDESVPLTFRGAQPLDDGCLLTYLPGE